MVVPDRIEAGLAPGGVVGIVLDADGNEITRSVITPDRDPLIDFLALDAASALNDRGAGRLVMYDGDTGERMVTGPELEVGPDGKRMPTTHHISDLRDLVPVLLDQFDGHWPWMCVGVFSIADTEMPGEWWNDFVYTVGFTRGAELWVPNASIEGRYAPPQLVSDMLNVIATGCHFSFVQPGDSVVIPLGVPDADDIDTVWWLGKVELNDGYRRTYQSDSPYVVPILWSSGLGWDEPYEKGTADD